MERTELKERIEELEERVEKLEAESEEKEKHPAGSEAPDRIRASRRGFLKAVSAGAAGLGVAGMTSSVTGQDTTGAENVVRAREVSGELFAPHFDGNGLASRVETALAYMREQRGSRGRILIPPRRDGSPWIWDKQLKIDPTLYNGLEIIVYNSTEIRYPGSEWTIWVDTTWEQRDQNGIRIIGGKWHSTGDAEGWLRSDDTYRAQYAPDEVVYDSDDSTGVQIRNINGWSEEYMIGGRGVGHIKAGTGIDLLGAGDAGGDGTDSHHGGIIQDLAAVKGHQYAMKVNARVQYGTVATTTFRPWSDGARLLYLNPPTFSDRPSGRLDGMFIQNCKFEDAGGGASTQGSSKGEVAVRLGPRYDNWYGPVAIANHAWVNKRGSAHPDARNPQFLNLKMQSGYMVDDWISGEKKKFKME